MMKNILSRLLVLLFLITISSCEMDLFKKFEKDLPVVEVKEIKSTIDNITIYGNIVDDSGAPIKYCGFCYDKNRIPLLSDNQILIEREAHDLGSFSAVLKNVYYDSTYYFIAFATNEHGYSKSIVKKITIPCLESVEVPCELDDNIIIADDVSYSCRNSSYNNYSIRASCYYSGGPLVTVSFDGKPQNGIYTTVNERTGDKNREVVVSIQVEYEGTYTVNTGGKVYVNNTDSSIVVTFCELTYSTYDRILRGNVYLLNDE